VKITEVGDLDSRWCIAALEKRGGGKNWGQSGFRKESAFHRKGRSGGPSGRTVVAEAATGGTGFGGGGGETL